MTNDIKLSVYSHGDDEVSIPVAKSSNRNGKQRAARAFLPLKGITRSVYTYGMKKDNVEANSTDYFTVLAGFKKGRINGESIKYCIFGLTNKYRGLTPSCSWVRAPIDQLKKNKGQ